MILPPIVGLKPSDTLWARIDSARTELRLTLQVVRDGHVALVDRDPQSNEYCILAFQPLEPQRLLGFTQCQGPVLDLSMVCLGDLGWGALWSKRHSAWHRPHGLGYTPRHTEAGLYPLGGVNPEQVIVPLRVHRPGRSRA